MLTINSVTYSKNPVNTGETFLISVSVTETMATWQDVAAKTWNSIKVVTWSKVRYKIF